MGTIARQKSLVIPIRRGPAVGPFAWNQNSKSPRAPERFCADPALIALGQALSARITDATRLTAEAAAAAGLFELASGRFAKPMHDVQNLATRVIARFLTTGQGTTETERHFIARVGVMAAVFGVSIATLTRSYVLWRDTNLRVLNEEVKRLGTALAVSDVAQRIIRSSADTGVARMVQAYDDQMKVIARRYVATPVGARRYQHVLEAVS
jgi:hypothetical protein